MKAESLGLMTNLGCLMVAKISMGSKTVSDWAFQLAVRSGWLTSLGLLMAGLLAVRIPTDSEKILS